MQDSRMKPPSDVIYVAASEHERLFNLSVHSVAPAAVALREGLARAIVVGEDEAPRAFARLHSTVAYAGPGARRRTSVTLVTPAEADIDAGRVSILTPMGAALFGRVPGARFDWPWTSGPRLTGTILSVRAPI